MKMISPNSQSQVECKAWFQDVLDAVPTGWIAGGCLRDYFSRTPCTSDVDVYFKGPSALLAGLNSIETTKGAKPLYDHPHIQGYLLNGKHIQLIKHKFFDTAEETIANFDFTVCSAALTNEGQVFVHPEFFEDLAARRIGINNVSCPYGTLERLQRYIKKGFHAGTDTLLKLAVALQSVDFTNPDENKLQFYPGGEERFGRFDEQHKTAA